MLWQRRLLLATRATTKPSALAKATEGEQIKHSACKHINSTVQEEEGWLYTYQDLRFKGFKSISQGERPFHGIFMTPFSISTLRSSTSSCCTTM